MPEPIVTSCRMSKSGVVNPRAAYAHATDAIAIVLPAERSIPAVMITNVAPTAATIR